MIFASPLEAERAGESMNRSIKFIMVLSVALGFATQAQAAADCYRHLDCPDDELCINTVCTEPEEPLDECTGDGPCNEDGTCDDGFCKRDGVYCENPAGHCYEESARSSCRCEDGMGMVSGMDPAAEAPSLTDEELYAQCQEELISGCGEEAPDISDECTDEQLSLCTDMLERINQFLEACGDEPRELGYRRLASCCRDVDDESFQEFHDCITDLDVGDCEGFEGCMPEVMPGGGVPIGPSDSSDSREGDSEQGVWVADGGVGVGADGEGATLVSPGAAPGGQDDAGAADEEDGAGAADAEADDSGCAVAPALGSGSPSALSSFALLLGLLFASRIASRRRVK